MSWSLRVITSPVTEVVTASELKAQSRVDFADEDTYIGDLAVAARAYTEEYLSRALITQTLELGIPCFPWQDRIRLPRGPVQSVTNITYTDSALVDHTMTQGTDFLVDLSQELAQIIVPFGRVWPTAVLSTARPIVIRYVAGYGDAASDVPTPIKLAIKQLAASWYENRETYMVGRSVTAIPLPMAYESLLATYRLRYSGPF